MEINELKEKLHVNDFGLLSFYTKNGNKNHVHGKIKFIDEDGTILFKDTDRFKYTLGADKIFSFELKEMLPEVKEYRGKSVTWDGGRLILTESKREIDLKR